MATCKFCQDAGCIACPGEQANAPAPTMPEPIFTAKLNNAHDMKLLKEYFGRESVESGIVPGVYPNARSFGNDWELRGALASLLQKLHGERGEDDG